MISRLTASAALFAILATATLSFATETHTPDAALARRVDIASPAMDIVMLPMVTVIGHRER